MVFDIQKAVEEAFLKADAFYKQKVPRCKIKYDLTGTTAGTANFTDLVLRFNLKLGIANKEKFLETTVPHEVAHIVAFWKFGTGIDPHGQEWKKVMIQVFRLPPKRCHHYDTSKVKRKTKQYIYHCDCPGKEHPMGKIKHDKLRLGKRVSQCLTCGAKLVFSKKLGKKDGPSNRIIGEIDLD